MTMDCRDARELLYAYSDNELDALTSRELESHLRQCGGCERAFAADQAVKKAMANPALRRPAPGLLRERVAASAETLRPRWNAWNILQIAAALAIGMGLALFVPGVLTHSGNALDADEALASHLRSMQNENHLMDVQSTDQHTVKPWFDGRLDFAPPVRDLADHGFPLAGGRTDFMHGRPVAALIYHRNKHIINLFIWPGETGQSVAEKQGYNLLHWSDGGMTFWAVSDLNTGEMGQFEDLFRGEK
jgi:mycothiol system anti-sigma-R factor